MDAEMLFIGTGASEDIFTENVRNDYDNYKYFIRGMPNNSTALGGFILESFIGFILTFQATYGIGWGGYGTHDIKQIGILSEDLSWTTDIVAMIVGLLPYYLNLTSIGYGFGPYELEILTPLLYDITLSATDMNMHLQSLEADGADIVIPLISAQGGVLMMQQYNQYEYEYLIIGIDVQSQMDSFWEASGESAAHETQMQANYRTAKTPLTIEFWDTFRAEFGHDPIYLAMGAYDAVKNLVFSIEAIDSLDTEEIITQWETYTTSNTRTGVSGVGAWYPDSHDLVPGYPYGFPLWCEWLPDGTKIVIPSAMHPDSIATGTYTLPPWVIDAWT